MATRRDRPGSPGGAGDGAGDFRLVDHGWERIFDESMGYEGERLRIICPFIKRGVVERLLAHGEPARIEVITRYDLRAFGDGVSDIEALALLLDRGASIRGIRNLHAKVYQFGRSRAIVTSANLTRAALRSNHEFGFASEAPDVMRRCEEYFEGLWEKAGPDLIADRLFAWRDVVERFRLRGAPPAVEGLGDEGVDVGLPDEEVELLPPAVISSRSFVKFFGEATSRAERSLLVQTEVERTGCHWACTYPKGKRPRQAEDESAMFMARLVKRPDDVIIFGRGIAYRHRPRRDDATPEDIALRSFKEKWPHYVRVHHTQFLAGDLTGGVSLFEMMDALGAESFASTSRNAKKGDGNTDPRRAYMQRADVELTPRAYRWISDRLDAAFRYHGILPPAAMAALDWPDLTELQVGP